MAKEVTGAVDEKDGTLVVKDADGKEVRYVKEADLLAAMATDSEWAYLAGIIDGEGSIFIHAQRDACNLGTARLTIANTNGELISWIVSIFGGTIQKVSAGRKNPLYLICWESNQIEKILIGVLPYLVCKKRQAYFALAARSLILAPGETNTDCNRLKRSAISEIMFTLNHPGESKAFIKPNMEYNANKNFWRNF